MELGLGGKVAVVTGASRGIGKAVAHSLLAEGCAVAICGRNAERLDAAVRELSATGGHVLGVPTDVTDETAVRKFVDASLETFGRIDILVNNAGTHLRGTVESTTLAILEQQLRDKAVRVLRDDPGGAANDEAPARRTDRQYRRAGGASSASRPTFPSGVTNAAADGDDQVGRRRGGARQHPRQRGLSAIHRIRSARLAHRQGDARARGRSRHGGGRLHARQSVGAHRAAGRGRRPGGVPGVRLRELSSPAARSASTAAITATFSGEDRHMDLGLAGRTALITGGTSGHRSCRSRTASARRAATSRSAAAGERSSTLRSPS